ncbi:MAG: hypothetical protein L7U87_02375 [Chlamydiales bacterium]|nr:hypothetical protein [Chlamydiales bacterium]
MNLLMRVVVYPIILCLLFSCSSSDEIDLTADNGFKDLLGQEFILKKDVYIVRKQSGRETRFQIGVPGKTPWPKVENYIYNEVKSLPSGQQIVSLLKKGQKLKLSGITSKKNVLDEDILHFYSTLSTSQGESLVEISLIIGSYIRPQGIGSRSIFKENLFVKPLK